MNGPFRLLVTGSRGWSDTDRFRAEMDALALFARTAGATELVVVHGACYPRTLPGTSRRPHESADWLAHLWVTLLLDHPLPTREEPHPANWTADCRATCRPGHRRQKPGERRSICPYAGHYRNQHMVDLGADQGVGFWLDQSHGTGDCIRRMTEAGIPVRRVEATTTSPIHKH